MALYAVVIRAYVPAKSASSEDSATVFNLKGGDIHEVVGSEYGKRVDGAAIPVWYRIKSDSGECWVRGGDVVICETKERAEKTAELYR
ncbi:MAG: hypothetical protein NT080_14775 [Spirochaetes bacterium]|nr:hypothetical protein [Spirochaetota bacterium]